MKRRIADVALGVAWMVGFALLMTAAMFAFVAILAIAVVASK